MLKKILAVIGFVALLATAVAGVLYYLKRRREEEEQDEFSFDDFDFDDLDCGDCECECECNCEFQDAPNADAE